MHLLEPSLEPADLLLIDAAGGAASWAGGVERDVSDVRRVVHVVRGPVAAVVLAETVAGRPGARSEVCFYEFVAADRSPPCVRCDIYVGTRHECVRPMDEVLERCIAVESGWQPHGLAVTDHGRSQLRCDDSDSLAEPLVVAVAAQPRQAQAARAEGLERALEQPRHGREAIG